MTVKVLPELRVSLLKRLITDLDYNILYWDCETSPNEGYWFDSDKPQYMSYKQIKKGKETKIMSVQYMFEGDSKPKYLSWDKEGNNFNDASMLEEFITNIMRKYPQDKVIIIGQNHKAFDHMILNQRAKKLRLTPPTHNMIKIDTYKQSKQAFRTASHSLDARSDEYGLGGKIKMELKDWTDILEGRVSVEDKMIPYGLKDVTDLRTVFWNDLPYYEKLPAPLESLLVKAMAKCLRCEAIKKPKYNIIECKVNGKKGYECLNCGERFIV